MVASVGHCELLGVVGIVVEGEGLYDVIDIHGEGRRVGGRGGRGGGGGRRKRSLVVAVVVCGCC